MAMSMSDFVACAFGAQSEQVSMVRRWIDAGEHIWAGSALDGIAVHVHAQTRDGLDAGVNLPVWEVQVLADYAESVGHPGAESMAKAWRAMDHGQAPAPIDSAESAPTVVVD
jgi:hypothetical protein